MQNGKNQSTCLIKLLWASLTKAVNKCIFFLLWLNWLITANMHSVLTMYTNGVEILFMYYLVYLSRKPYELGNRIIPILIRKLRQGD